MYVCIYVYVYVYVYVCIYIYIYIYISALVGVCKLNKLQNARCNDKDKGKSTNSSGGTIRTQFGYDFEAWLIRMRTEK